MLKIVNEEQYQQIVQYIQQQLLTNHIEWVDDTGPGHKTIDIESVQKLQETCPYTNYQQSCGKKQKPEVGDSIKAAWKEFWSIWPSTSNFEYAGKKFTGNKVMKKGEAKCMEKWLNAAKQDGCTIKLLKHAAEVHLEYVKQASWKSGRNEMQYMNNLEVWLNGAVYKNWMHMEMPQNSGIITRIYQNSIDM